MKKLNKTLAILLALTMVLGLLAGCGTQKPAETQTATQAPTNAPASESTTQPAAAEPVTLTLVIKDVSPDDPLYQEWLRQFNENLLAAGIGAQLELVSLQSGTYSENLSLLLNSGTIPDIIYFQGGDEDFALNQKILEDLTPYVENSTYIKGIMEENSYMLTRMSNYPYLLYLSVLSTKIPVIRTDLLDKLAIKDTFLKDPSIDNWYELLKEAKEAGGYDFGYTIPGNLSEINNVFDQAFGLTTTWVKGDDGKYVYGRTTDASLQELKFYAKLLADGLLDNEYLTHNWENKENMFYGTGAAVISGTQGAVIDSYNAKQIAANGEGAYLTVLPPAKGVAQGYTPVDTSKESRGFAISAMSEHKDLAFAVLEYAASPDGRLLDLLGFEGQHYQRGADGKIEILEGHNSWYSVFFGLTANLDMNEISEKTPYMAEPALESLAMFQKYSSDDNVVVIPADYAVAWSDATAVFNEFAADFVLGNKTEADWDAFVAAWNEAGGSTVTEYVNTVLK